MLVFNRMAGEKIHIGDDIVITVLEIRGRRVRLGFDAPTSVVIDREEVFEAKRKGAIDDDLAGTDEADPRLRTLGERVSQIRRAAAEADAKAATAGGGPSAGGTGTD